MCGNGGTSTTIRRPKNEKQFEMRDNYGGVPSDLLDATGRRDDSGLPK